MSRRFQLRPLEPRRLLSAQLSVSVDTATAPLDLTTPLAFPPVAAGVILGDRGFHTFFLPSTFAGNTVVDSVSILGDGFVSPDLAATNFPLTIPSSGQAYGYYGGVLPSFRVYASSPDVGTASAILRIVISAPVPQTIDVPLSATFDPAVAVPVYATADGKPIGNGQTVGLHKVAYSRHGGTADRYVTIGNAGNAPFTYASTLSSYFVANPSQPLGSSDSASFVAAIGNVTPYNPFAHVEVIDTPGLKPGGSDQLHFTIPDGQTGVYHAAATVTPGLPGAAPVKFRATAAVVVSKLFYDTSASTVSGKVTDPVRRGVSITGFSSPRWSKSQVVAQFVDDRAVPATVTLRNTGTSAYHGSISLLLRTNLGAGTTNALRTIDIDVPAGSTANYPLTLTLPANTDPSLAGQHALLSAALVPGVGLSASPYSLTPRISLSTQTAIAPH